MAIKFTTTRQSGRFVKLLVYGRSGMGKTTLCATAPNPIIISTENKLLAIADHDIPVIEVKTTEDLIEAVDFCESKQAKKFDTVCVDSITDIAEAVLSDLKRQYTDPRRAYGDLADVIGDCIRRLRDIKKKHLYCIAKTKRIQDEGIEMHTPSMPGQTLMTNLPYFFDFVFAIRINDDEDNPYRFLQTQPDWKFDAKSTGSNLDDKEKPDLAHIFSKALKQSKPTKNNKQDK